MKKYIYRINGCIYIVYQERADVCWKIIGLDCIDGKLWEEIERDTLEEALMYVLEKAEIYPYPDCLK